MNAKLIGLTSLILIVLIGGIYSPSSAVFLKDISSKFPTTLGYLFLVAIFVERAIEVFLSAWRSEQADNLDLQISQKKLQFEEAVDTDHLTIQNELQLLEKERADYSAQSRIYAIWMGIIIGALISAVGIRALDTIVDTSTMISSQKQLFIGIDILLTAALLAGGSDAINKLMKTYNNFIMTTNNKINKDQ